MSGFIHARLVPHAAIGTQIVNVRGLATCIPIQEETRPTVVMHRFSRAWRRDDDLQHADEAVFEDHLVAIGSGLGYPVLRP